MKTPINDSDTCDTFFPKLFIYSTTYLLLILLFYIKLLKKIASHVLPSFVCGSCVLQYYRKYFFHYCVVCDVWANMRRVAKLSVAKETQEVPQ